MYMYIVLREITLTGCCEATKDENKTKYLCLGLGYTFRFKLISLDIIGYKLIQCLYLYINLHVIRLSIHHKS